MGGYWGNIKTNTDVSHFWTTRPDKDGELHVPFKTPENCALYVDEKWKQIVNDEQKRNKI